MSERSERVNPWQLLKLIAAADLPALACDLLRASVLYLDCATLQMYPSLARLASDMKRDIRTVRRVLNGVLVPRGILVAKSERAGGRVAATGAGLSTIYRLDLDALERCRRPAENPGRTPGYGDANPGDHALDPGPQCAETRATALQNPGTPPAKHPVDIHSNSHPTPTGGGGGGRVSLSQEEENRKALAGIVNQPFRRNRIASKTDPNTLKATIDYANRNDLGGGWVVSVLDGKGVMPAEIAASAERIRTRRVEEAARLEAARTRLEAIPQDRLAAVAAHAGVAPDDTSPGALEALALSLDALTRQEADTADHRRLTELWETLDAHERETLRCRFQCYTPEGVLAFAGEHRRNRAMVLAAIDTMR